jgi:hypothetical protein
MVSGEVDETNEPGLLKKIWDYIYYEYKNSPVKTFAATLSITCIFLGIILYITSSMFISTPSIPRAPTPSVEILHVANENSNILYQTQNGTKEPAAEKVRSTFTIRNNGPRAAFLKGIRIEEQNRTFHPSRGPLVSLSPDFEKAVVIESTKLHIDIPLSYIIPPNDLGQFALVFSSNVQGGNLEIWIKVTLIYDAGSEVSEILHLSIQNYGYIMRADPGNRWLITPGR